MSFHARGPACGRGPHTREAELGQVWGSRPGAVRKATEQGLRGELPAGEGEEHPQNDTRAPWHVLYP